MDFISVIEDNLETKVNKQDQLAPAPVLMSDYTFKQLKGRARSLLYEYGEDSSKFILLVTMNYGSISNIDILRFDFYREYIYIVLAKPYLLNSFYIYFMTRSLNPGHNIDTFYKTPPEYINRKVGVIIPNRKTQKQINRVKTDLEIIRKFIFDQLIPGDNIFHFQLETDKVYLVSQEQRSESLSIIHTFRNYERTIVKILNYFLTFEESIHYTDGKININSRLFDICLGSAVKPISSKINNPFTIVGEQNRFVFEYDKLCELSEYFKTFRNSDLTKNLDTCQLNFSDSTIEYLWDYVQNEVNSAISIVYLRELFELGAYLVVGKKDFFTHLLNLLEKNILEVENPIELLKDLLSIKYITKEAHIIEESLNEIKEHLELIETRKQDLSLK